MAESTIDAFLQVREAGSKTYMPGESTATGFKVAPIEILSFSLSPPDKLEESDEEEDSPFEKNGKALAGLLGGGATFNRSAAGRGARKVAKARDVADSLNFQVTKNVDISSGVLLTNFCETLSRPTDAEKTCQFDVAKIILRKSGGEQIKFLIYWFGAVSVVSYGVEVNSDNPIETIRFSFRELEMRYSPQLAKGGREAKNVVNWNFAAPANSKAMQYISLQGNDES